MRKKYVSLGLTGIAAAACLLTGELSAWQRTAMDECKKDVDNCTKGTEKCKKELEKCKKEAPNKDQESFSRALNKYNQHMFKDLKMDQQKKAMDYADNNAMSPDDAVSKVLLNMKK